MRRDIIELILRTRTFRRFYEDRNIDDTILRDLVNTCRLGGSARNAQPLRYMIVSSDKAKGMIFPLLGWAGYLSDWTGPECGERPSAYIICLMDRQRLKGAEYEAHFDLGIASQNLLLVAMARGIGGCRVGSFSEKKVKELFHLKDYFKVLLVIALGYPCETVIMEKTVNDEDIKYWRDSTEVHHVPKRLLDDIILSCPF